VVLIRKNRALAYIVAGVGITSVLVESLQEKDITSIGLCLLALAAILYLFRKE
jgi:hypothetical protein